jgi:hypothetical protein
LLHYYRPKATKAATALYAITALSASFDSDLLKSTPIDNLPQEEDALSPM